MVCTPNELGKSRGLRQAAGGEAQCAQCPALIHKLRGSVCRALSARAVLPKERRAEWVQRTASG